ncbi:MAG: heavy metal transporter [Winogradskyella sp.]|nr:heavy metal transporter [Winogradskyella sp.]|tara:strand:+ start:317 stop:727 length:411 start_codon:yes stop_codon:yes gene_type:complete
MRNFKNIIVASALLLALTSCKDKAEPEVKTVDVEVDAKEVAKTLDPNANYAKVEFGIEGMTCAVGCAKTIEKKMAKMEGVKSVKVDFDKRMAMVEYDEAKVSPEALEETVTKVGEVYKVKDMKVVDDFTKETQKEK